MSAKPTSYRAWSGTQRKLAATKRQREQAERLKEHTISEMPLANGAKLLKLRAMPAEGAEYMEHWRWKL